jgi:hypothetical protein
MDDWNLGVPSKPIHQRTISTIQPIPPNNTTINRNNRASGCCQISWLSLEEPEILSLKEASEISLYSADYLSLLARRGRIGALKEGNKWMITKPELIKYVNEMKSKKNN